MLQSGGQNQKWPTCGPGGYITPTIWGSPNLQSGGQNHKWPTCGPSGYKTPTVWGVPNTLGPGTKSEVAHMWADWLDHPYHLGGPQCFKAGDKIRIGPHVGLVATSPLLSWGVAKALRRGTKSEMAHKWADWLHHPYHLGGPKASERGTKSEKKISDLRLTRPGGGGGQTGHCDEDRGFPALRRCAITSASYQDPENTADQLNWHPTAAPSPCPSCPIQISLCGGFRIPRRQQGD